MSPVLLPYDRRSAVDYAHRWAFDRNPRYLNFDRYGGDCTSFASQCLFAGTGVMNYTPTFGWYYRTANDRTPSWTGVPYFFDFLTRKQKTPGPAAIETDPDDCQPGDFVQLSFDGRRFAHTPVIVSIRHPASPETILVVAHTDDSDLRPLSSYTVQRIRYLHITGYYR